MNKDVRRYVRRCQVCDLFRSKSCKYGMMHGFTEVKQPFERISMDFIGPLSLTPRGNKFALVMIDHFSRYIKASTVPQNSANCVIQALHEKILF